MFSRSVSEKLIWTWEFFFFFGRHSSNDPNTSGSLLIPSPCIRAFCTSTVSLPSLNRMFDSASSPVLLWTLILMGSKAALVVIFQSSLSRWSLREPFVRIAIGDGGDYSHHLVLFGLVTAFCFRCLQWRVRTNQVSELVYWVKDEHTCYSSEIWLSLHRDPSSSGILLC